MAAMDLYGLLSYSVSRRTREIGVRIALGAGTWRVRWMVIVEGLVPVAVGIAIGLVASTRPPGVHPVYIRRQGATLNGQTPRRWTIQSCSPCRPGLLWRSCP